MTDQTNDVQKLRDLVDTDDVVMLTTVAQDGGLEARPMSVRDVDAEGRLWFFTEYRAPKVEELRNDPRTLVTLAKRNYVSIQGTATVVQDPARQTELWNKASEAWLQCEPTDPKVALLVVDPEGAQYWETPGVAAGVLGVVSAAVKGERPDIGTNETLDLR
jgi:general stress protein 26